MHIFWYIDLPAAALSLNKILFNNDKILDLPSSLLASTMVAMEISLNAILKVGEYPIELLEKVAIHIYH